MSSGRILVADDEPSVRESVGYALGQEGFEVTIATDGDDADSKLGDGEVPFDLLILDIMMPGRSGLDLCRDVRGRSPVPIILLTAKDAEVDKVVGLEVERVQGAAGRVVDWAHAGSGSNGCGPPGGPRRGAPRRRNMPSIAPEATPKNTAARTARGGLPRRPIWRIFRRLSARPGLTENPHPAPAPEVAP